MRIFLLIIYFSLSFPLLAEDVYRTVDEHGNVIYTDTPAQGAEKIRVDEVQTINPGDVPQFVYTQPADAGDTYSRLEIVSPENDSVIQGNNVTVSVALEPPLNLRTGHYLELRLDGNEAASGSGLQFTLSNLERGTHTLDMAVVDQSGNRLIISPPVSFTIYQQSVPKPKPAPK